jgi:hypothetical protein
MSSAQEYIESLSDEDLINLTKVAVADLAEAAEDFPNSDYHSACFAGFTMLSIECENRNLKISTIH